MKLKLRIFLIAFQLFSLNSLAFICVYNKPEGPIPDPEDPYQVMPKNLSDEFLSKYKFDSNKVITMGDYEIYINITLGTGDDGRVYLAMHVPTKIYVAAKRRYVVKDKINYHLEYRKLRALGRLFSAWINDQGLVYFIIPLVDGKIISEFQYENPWISFEIEEESLTTNDPFVGLTLLNSLKEELLYMAKKGIIHDSSVGNVMVTNDHKYVVLIDFGWSCDISDSNSIDLPTITPKDYNVYSYGIYATYLFGIRKYFRELKENEIKKPKEVVAFLKMISNPNNDFKPVYLDAFVNGLKKVCDYYSLVKGD